MAPTAVYKKVALAGATGTLGSVVLSALLASNFDVTVLTRKDSTSKLTPDTQTTTVAVDYADVSSIQSALVHHDVLISTLTSSAVSIQENLIHAAVAVGVKRIIPSEFGSDTYNPLTRKLPSYTAKVAIQELLVKLSSETPSMTYTVIMNNAFFDWGLEHAFLVDVKNRRADLYDGGDRPFSVTTLPVIAKAVVRTLQRPDETANKHLYVHEAVVTQNQLIRLAKKNGSGEFETTEKSTKALEEWAYAELKKEGGNRMGAIFSFIYRAIWGEGYGGEFKKVDNELLGIKMMSDDEIEGVVKNRL